MDTKILSDWIIPVAQAQRMNIYYLINDAVSPNGDKLFEYPTKSGRVCLFHSSWLDQIYDICNDAGIVMQRIGAKVDMDMAGDKMALLRKLVELKSAVARRHSYYCLTWNNQRISADLVYELQQDRYIAMRGAFLFVVTEAGKAKVMESAKL